MLGEVGHVALILALMLSFIGMTLPHVAANRGDERIMRYTDRITLGVFFMVATSFAALTIGFLISDFSLRVVAANSHSLKPLLYKITGVWGNHEGSVLFWALNLSIFGAAVAALGQNLPIRFRSRVLAVQMLIIFGFILFMLLTSNPFDRLNPAPFEGNGLNPLLQDPGLAFHPPMLYLGYVGLSVAFSFAIAALLEREVTPQWARWVRPWTLAAWVFLTGGLALGSWWAYYELGWGGWWFWDPTENAAFMPWLVATALLHSAIVVEKRDALRSWTILLAIVAFSFSLLGTFIVRSGIVTSVHAFATDPARGIFILVFLALVVGGSLLLFALRAPEMKGGGLFKVVSREGALILNNVLLSVYAAVVLIGTLYPLLNEALTGTQISVGPPAFNFFTIVLMSPLIVAVGFGPLMAWKRGQIGRVTKWLLPALSAAIIVMAATYWSSIGGVLLTAFGVGLGGWLLVAVLIEVHRKLKIGAGSRRSLGYRLKAVKRSEWGMTLAHGGLAVMIFGIVISEAGTSETIAAMKVGDEVRVGAYDFEMTKVEPYVGPNFTAVQARFNVREDGELIAELTPQNRLYHDPIMPTTEASIHPLISGDLYATVGEAAINDRWRVRLYFKPFISGIWLGTFMMVIGGLISLSDRRLRIGTVQQPQKVAG